MKLTKKIFFKEVILWILVSIPFVYYGIVYASLPEQIPIHFDINGNADNFASKAGYWSVLVATVLGIYFLMLIIPFIDPKGKIKQMGNKYYILRLILVALISLIETISIYAAQNPHLDIRVLIYLAIGLLFLLLGNYMPSFKPNYFVGIRTPWTLESEEIWRRTHRLGGWIWVITGVITIILALTNLNAIIFLLLILIAAFIPVLYSFILYLRRKKE